MIADGVLTIRATISLYTLTASIAIKTDLKTPAPEEVRKAKTAGEINPPRVAKNSFALDTLRMMQKPKVPSTHVTVSSIITAVKNQQRRSKTK